MSGRHLFLTGKYEMRMVYGVAAGAEILLLVICALRAPKRKSDLAKIVCLYEWAVVFCGLSYCTFLYARQVEIAAIGRSMMYICLDWVLYLFMAYTQRYTSLFEPRPWIKRSMLAWSLVNTGMYMCNIWTHHIFRVTLQGAENRNIQFGRARWWNHVNMMYCCVLLVLLLIIYGLMLFRASRLYLIHYEAIGCTLLLGCILRMLPGRFMTIYDMSFLVFGLMSLFIYYFTFCYVSNELMENAISVVINDMNNGLICFNNIGKCIYCNQKLKELYHIENGTEQMEEEFIKWKEKEGAQRKHTIQYETTILENNVQRTYDVSYKYACDKKGNYVCDYFMFHDKTEQLKKLEWERYRASHDSLTGLYNKEEFYRRVERLLKEYPDTEFYILCSNMKDFKFVNELFGMKKGNAILRKQAEQMKQLHGSFAKTVCARIQDDHFATCIPKAYFDEDKIVEKIRNMQKEFTNSLFHLHLYIGVYEITNREEPVSKMCDKANLASETIKNDYKTCITYYDRHLLEQSIAERKIIGEFEEALEKEEFVMFLQPQTNEQGKMLGAEALVRWQHPERGLLGPYAFIDVLEKTGLIHELDKYMWEQAAKKLGEWKKEGKEEYHISVNISAKDFYFINIYKVLVGLTEKYQISPKKLKLEITETALMSNFEKNIAVLNRLQEYGFCIEIDDFGSGYSSLNMLRNIRADVLKIDNGFLRDSENEERGMEILESVVLLARKIDMEVIMEGVETKEQLLMLTEMGCRMFQGYYFSRPIPVEEFEGTYM